jgi:hypothetical protein
MKVCIIHVFISLISDAYILLWILWTGIHNDGIIHANNN